MRVGKKWGELDLNQRPTGYESAALTAELLPQGEKFPNTISQDAIFCRLFLKIAVY